MSEEIYVFAQLEFSIPVGYIFDGSSFDVNLVSSNGYTSVFSFRPSSGSTVAVSQGLVLFLTSVNTGYTYSGNWSGSVSGPSQSAVGNVNIFNYYDSNSNIIGTAYLNVSGGVNSGGSFSNVYGVLSHGKVIYDLSLAANVTRVNSTMFNTSITINNLLTPISVSTTATSVGTCVTTYNLLTRFSLDYTTITGLSIIGNIPSGALVAGELLTISPNG